MNKYKKFKVKEDFHNERKYPSRSLPIIETMREKAGQIIEAKTYDYNRSQLICKANYQWKPEWLEEQI